MKNEMTLATMEPSARSATREALRDKAVTDEMWKNIVLGSGHEGEYGVFELYIPGKRPRDAQVIARAQVHRITGKVDVKIFV